MSQNDFLGDLTSLESNGNQSVSSREVQKHIELNWATISEGSQAIPDQTLGPQTPETQLGPHGRVWSPSEESTLPQAWSCCLLL